jgi:hypothetical protein
MGLMEIVNSIFIGIISSKIVSKIDGIVLQCGRDKNWRRNGEENGKEHGELNRSLMGF